MKNLFPLSMLVLTIVAIIAMATASNVLIQTLAGCVLVAYFGIVSYGAWALRRTNCTKRVIVQLYDAQVSMVQQPAGVHVEVRDYNYAGDLEDCDVELPEEFGEGVRRVVARDEAGDTYEAYVFPAKE